MEDEFNLDVEDTTQINNNNTRAGRTIDSRVSNLTEKLKTETEEKARLAQEVADANAKVQSLEKENAFNSSFSDSTSQYPQASEYKDAIKEKVLAGYSVEDATVSVLAKEGKLTSQPTRENIAGGSATNAMQAEGTKSLRDMERADKRAALIEAENEGGGLSAILRSGH